MIWVHAGLAKTGTSSIQAALRLIRHRSRYSVWTIGDAPQPLSPEWNTWVERRATSGDVIVSDEGLLGDPLTGYADLPQRIMALREALPDVPITLVLGLRRQSTWVQSMYLQSLQQGGSMYASEFWSQLETSPYVLWSNLVAEAESAFGQDAVRVFLHQDGRDAVTDFFSLCGLKPPPSMGRPIRENVSVSATQAPIVRRFNEMSTPTEQKAMRRFLQLVAGPDPSGKFSVLPESTTSSIGAACRTDWHDLITRLSSTGQLAHSQANSAEWLELEDAYPGDDLNCPPVEREILRLLSVAVANSRDIQARSVMARLVDKVRINPRDLPAAAVRVLRRPRAH